jgi:hypothetical protein
VNRAYRWSVIVFALAFIVIGVALIVVTAAAGGGVTGFVLGGLFLALGAARLTMQLRMGRR